MMQNIGYVNKTKKIEGIERKKLIAMTVTLHYIILHLFKTLYYFF